MVCIGSVRSVVRLGWVPAASVTAIVSPTARETASTIAGHHARRGRPGSTTRVETMRLVAPTP